MNYFKGEQYMFCTKCGAKNPEDATFCYKCGSEMYLTPQSPSGDKSKIDNKKNNLYYHFRERIHGRR